MKFALPKYLSTGVFWDGLTILFACLTGMVCLVYGIIFAYPQVLPIVLQVPAKAPTLTPAAILAMGATRPFPTFPAEWTAVFATRHPQALTSTPTPLGSASGEPVTPGVSLTLTITTEGLGSPLPNLTPSTTPTATVTLLTPALLSPSPSAVTATATLAATSLTPLPSPATPLATPSPESYPTYAYPAYPYPNQ
jgi:hypothetical protein